MTPNDQPASSAYARVGTWITPKYLLENLIGVGGMAAVYAARHRNQNRVAIKVLEPALCLDTDIVRRFVREGYLANSVNHRGTVRVIDDDVSREGAPFLVMELLSGETLDQRAVTRGGTLAPEEAIPIALELLDVLAAAHDKAIVHRDVKPENVFITHTGEVKVLDFGIARLLSGAMSATKTSSGVLMGTPAYMAPEQALGRGDLIDARADVFAVGATLFALLVGKTLDDDAASGHEMVIRRATRPSKGLRETAPHIDLRVAEVVDRAIAFGREARWSSAREMQSALRDAAGRISLLPIPKPTTARPPPLSAPNARLASLAGATTTLIDTPRHARLIRGFLIAAAVLAVVGSGSFFGVRTIRARRASASVGAPSVAVASPQPQESPSTAASVASVTSPVITPLATFAAASTSASGAPSSTHAIHARPHADGAHAHPPPPPASASASTPAPSATYDPLSHQ